MESCSLLGMTYCLHAVVSLFIFLDPSCVLVPGMARSQRLAGELQRPSRFEQQRCDLNMGLLGRAVAVTSFPIHPAQVEFELSHWTSVSGSLQWQVAKYEYLGRSNLKHDSNACHCCTLPSPRLNL